MSVALVERPADGAGAGGRAAEALVVDVEGFEGPLDLLLALARRQTVDLARVSVLDLARQYLAFVEVARGLRIELAADYLVVAAWLAYLKSRLLLPPDPAEAGPSADEMAARLARRLERLEAMRAAAAALMARPRLGRDVHPAARPRRGRGGGSSPAAPRCSTSCGATPACGPPTSSTPTRWTAATC